MKPIMKRGLILWLPLALVCVLFIVFWRGLMQPDDHVIASQMVGKPLPEFAFPAAMPPVPPDDNSPVILLGDSHTIVFSEAGGTIKNHTTGSGLRDHLQVRLGTPLAVIATAASGLVAALFNLPIRLPRTARLTSPA